MELPHVIALLSRLQTNKMTPAAVAVPPEALGAGPSSSSSAASSSTQSYDPFPDFKYTGPLRPAYPLAPKSVVPAHIQKPNYARESVSIFTWQGLKERWETSVEVRPFMTSAVFHLILSSKTSRDDWNEVE